jgi:SSS family solute:Na+ symporter
MQLIGILFISPFFIVFLLGMFWKRPSATAGFAGMVAGLSGATLEYGLYRLGVLRFTSPMASNVWTAVWGLIAGLVVTVAASFLTAPPPAESLKGLVYSRALAKPTPRAWYSRPGFYGAVVIAIFIFLNWKFF